MTDEERRYLEICTPKACIYRDHDKCMCTHPDSCGNGGNCEIALVCSGTTFPQLCPLEVVPKLPPNLIKIHKICEHLIDAAYHYKEEGYKAKIDFISELVSIYPDLRYEGLMLMMSENSRRWQKYCMDPLTDEQQKRYEERIRKRYKTILYAHHYQKYGHVDITAIGGIPPVYWHEERGEL